MQFSTKTIVLGVAALLLLATAAITVVLRPKSEPLSINPQYFTGYYSGGFFFPKRYYKVVFDSGADYHWEVDLVRLNDYCPYRVWYRDGTLQEEGEMFVESSGPPSAAEPAPDDHNVRWCNCYRPDGSASSQVRDGTGVQTRWHANGALLWRLELRNYQRVRHELRKADGSLVSEQQY